MKQNYVFEYLNENDFKVKERTERYNISVYPETELSIELLWQKENLFKRLLKQINYVGLL